MADTTQLTTPTQLTIAKRFCGPNNSGNGGYSCGLLAQFVDGPATVRLRYPPPLDVAMHVEPEQDTWLLKHDDQVIAQAKPWQVDIAPPPPVNFATAQQAAQHYFGFQKHLYPNCFVCGTERTAGDALCIYAGAAADNLVAAPWQPHSSLCSNKNNEGEIDRIYLWAAMDCPGAYTFLPRSDKAILLGELSATILRPVLAHEQCVVTGTYLQQEGRKHVVATAIYRQSGEMAAFAKGTWIELQSI